MILRLRECIVPFFIVILYFNGGMSEVFHVGDEEGWNSDTNFASWSLIHNFTIGDFLVFEYQKNEHNVFEVTEGTYRSCNASTGVIAEYNSGNDEIELKEARNYWFICSVSGHCLDGMRFGIKVKEDDKPRFEVPVSGTAVESPAPSTSACADGFVQTLVFSIAFGILLTYLLHTV